MGCVRGHTPVLAKTDSRKLFLDEQRHLERFLSNQPVRPTIPRVYCNEEITTSDGVHVVFVESDMETFKSFFFFLFRFLCGDFESQFWISIDFELIQDYRKVE